MVEPKHVCVPTACIEKADGNVICSCGLVIGTNTLSTGLADLQRVSRRRQKGKYHFSARFSTVLRASLGEGESVLPEEMIAFLQSRAEKYRETTNFDYIWVQEQLKPNMLGLGQKHWSRLAEQSIRIAGILGLNGSKRPLSSLPKAQLNKEFARIARAWPDVKSKLAIKYGYIRQTFPNYFFILYKLLEKLGFEKEAKIVAKIRSIKTSELAHRQEILWRCICDHVGWAFIPTVSNCLTTEEGSYGLPLSLHLQYSGREYAPKKCKKTARPASLSPIPYQHLFKAPIIIDPIVSKMEEVYRYSSELDKQSVSASLQAVACSLRFPSDRHVCLAAVARISSVDPSLRLPVR